MAPDPGSAEWLRTWIGSSDPDRITVAGRDLADDVMGTMTLTELAYLLVTRREPSPSERHLVDVVLVALADHGLTPSALAARLTFTGAPEAIQGAVAAGLLGAGSVFLGPTGDTAQLLRAALDEHGVRGDADETTLRVIAEDTVRSLRSAGSRVPGLGHPVHRDQDPRTPRIYSIASEVGLLGLHLRLLGHVAAAHTEITGRHLPINGAGAAGAALLDAGLPTSAVRGFALIARAAGLVAHLVEEADDPIGRRLWLEVEERSRPSDH